MKAAFTPQRDSHMNGKAGHGVRAVVVAVALIAIAACGGARQRPPHLDVSISEISLAQAGVLEQIYAITLRVQNPNNFDIDADGLSFTIEANGHVFAKGVSNQAVLIPRLGETLVQARAISDLSKIAEQIDSAQSIRNEGLSYRLAGRFFSGNQRYVFDYQGNIALTP